MKRVTWTWVVCAVIEFVCCYLLYLWHEWSALGLGIVLAVANGVEVQSRPMMTYSDPRPDGKTRAETVPTSRGAPS